MRELYISQAEIMSGIYRGRTVPTGLPELPEVQTAVSAMKLEFAQLSDRGRVREQNEDYLGYAAPENEARGRSHGWLFAVADGVGGHEDGEVASRLAVEVLLSGFQEAAPGEPHALLLRRLIQTANQNVHDAGLAAASAAPGRTMATTVVVCALRFDRATIAHVGDSRCYLIRRGQIHLLTRDHTLASEQLRAGIFSGTKASVRSVLTRSVGSELFVNVDINQHRVIPEDVLLLCSDGLHGAVNDADLLKAASGVDLQRSAARLVKLANERDGGDNVTLQLVRIRSVERIGIYRGRPYKLP